MSIAEGRMDGEMDATSPLCMGCSAMLAAVAGTFFHDIYPALAVWSLLASTILSTVGLWNLGRRIIRFFQARALTRRDTAT